MATPRWVHSWAPGIGAAIGNGVNHHNGASVGGAIGAIAGATIAANAAATTAPRRIRAGLLWRARAGVLPRTDELLHSGSALLRRSGGGISAAPHLRGSVSELWAAAVSGALSIAGAAERRARRARLGESRIWEPTGQPRSPWILTVTLTEERQRQTRIAAVPTSMPSGCRCSRFASGKSSATLLPLERIVVCCIDRLNPPPIQRLNFFGLSIRTQWLRMKSRFREYWDKLGFELVPILSKSS